MNYKQFLVLSVVYYSLPRKRIDFACYPTTLPSLAQLQTVTGNQLESIVFKSINRLFG
jgi:hypothetical protein